MTPMNAGPAAPCFQNIISIIMQAWLTQGIPFDSLGLYLSKETSHTMVLYSVTLNFHAGLSRMVVDSHVTTGERVAGWKYTEHWEWLPTS